MAKEKKKFSIYNLRSKYQIKNEEIVDSATEVDPLINNVLACYALSQRNHGAVSANYESDAYDRPMVIDVPANTIKAIKTIKLDKRFVGAGWRLSIWVYSQTDAANTLHLVASTGRIKVVTEDIEGTTLAWNNVIVSSPAMKNINLSDPLSCTIYLLAGDADVQCTIYGIGVHELTHPKPSSWTDTTGANNKIGDDDYPFSAALCNILEDNTRVCWESRALRSNIYTHWMGNYIQSSPGASYGANEDRLGRYMIVKRAGITAIEGLAMTIWGGSASSSADYKIGLYTTGGSLVTSDTINVAGTAGAYTWIEFQLTGLTSAETEYELRIDGKQSTGTVTSVTVHDVFAIDKPTGTSSVTLPERRNVQSNDDLLAHTWEKVKDTLEEIYYRRTQVSISDYHNFNYEIEGPSKRVFARGVLCPSIGSEKLICRAVLSRPSKLDRGGLAYDNLAGGTFTIGHTVTFGTSGASAIIVYDTYPGTGTTGELHLRGINGIPLDNEQITDGGVTADVNGVLYSPELTEVKGKFAIMLDTSAYLDYTLSTALYSQEIVFSNVNQGSKRRLEAQWELPIPDDYWNDYSLHSGVPLIWALVVDPAMTSGGQDFYDFLILHELDVFEEPLLGL